MIALAMKPIAPQKPPNEDPASLSSSASLPTNKRASTGNAELQSSDNMLAVMPQPALNKRPKLSLQTSSLPVTFGKSSTALMMTASALPTASPTVLNTFSNAYELPSRPSPATSSPFAAQATRRPSKAMAHYATDREEWPYKLPTGIKSILRNSLIPAEASRRSSLYSNTSSPRNSRRVFFPPTKKVCYSHPLEEEIRTARFVARHSDLSSSEESEADNSAPEEDLSDGSNDDDASENPAATQDDQPRSTKRLRKSYSHRQVRAAGMRDGLAGHSIGQAASAPQTPSDRRRRRRWEWTLGSLDEESVVTGKPSEEARVPTVSTPNIPLPPSATAFLDREESGNDKLSIITGVPAMSSPPDIPLPPSATAFDMSTPAGIPLPESAIVRSNPEEESMRGVQGELNTMSAD